MVYWESNDLIERQKEVGNGGWHEEILETKPETYERYWVAHFLSTYRDWDTQIDHMISKASSRLYIF